MSTDVTLGGETYSIPNQNEDPGFGEERHDWSIQVTDVLNSLSASDDILLTSATINNNVSSATNVNGMLFSTTTVRSFSVEYDVIRTDVGFSTVVQFGTLNGVYDGTNWTINDRHTSDAAVTFSITSGGQVQYYSSNIAISGSYTGTIKFKASTIAQ